MRRGKANIFKVFMFSQFRSDLGSVGVWMRLVLLQMPCSFFKLHLQHAHSHVSWTTDASRRESCCAACCPETTALWGGWANRRYELLLFWQGSVLWSALFGLLVSHAVSSGQSSYFLVYFGSFDFIWLCCMKYSGWHKVRDWFLPWSFVQR